VTGTHDAFVAARFDQSEARFKDGVASDDVRLRAIMAALRPMAGLRVLDLGCGKGRFAAHFQSAGAEVVGVDLSSAMLAHASGLDRVRASARRLPFADQTFDAVVAVEVLEHVGAVEPVLLEARRVLRPGGRVAIVDKNAGALDARRPWLPSLMVKWIDERRGLWMYPADGPVREHWFGPGALRNRLDRAFVRARVEFLLRPEEARWLVFRACPSTRLMALWTAQVPESPADIVLALRRSRSPEGHRGYTAGRTPSASNGSGWPVEVHRGTGGGRP
jgi:2-polyprenyl-6-hydroxyphenyl methylase/3-demethylubiquinone-9 3-methyltransferase